MDDIKETAFVFPTQQGSCTRELTSIVTADTSRQTEASTRVSNGICGPLGEGVSLVFNAVTSEVSPMSGQLGITN